MSCKKFFILICILALPCAAPAISIKYTYDAAGRLTKEAYSDGKIIEYTYDAAGNRTGHKIADSTSTSSSTSTTTITATTTTTLTPESTTTTAALTSSTTTIPASSTTTIIGGTTTTILNPTTTTTVGGPCPATQLLGPDNPKLESLRNFRDSRLAQSWLGRKCIQAYYRNSDGMNAALERSPALREFTRKAFEVIALLGAQN